MNPNWIGVISAVLAVVVLILTYASYRKAGRKPKFITAITACLLALPGASFSIYYLHILPESAWYYEFRSWPGIEFLLIFVGVAGGILAALLPRSLFILPLAAAAAFAAAPFVKPFVGPIPPSTLESKWDGDVCLQSTQSTCGPASAATILRHLGIESTGPALASESHSYIGGTEAWYLARAIRARGCKVCFHFSNGFDPDVPLPAIAGVDLGGIGHFIPILSLNGEVYTIGDPMHGSESMTKNVLLSRYTFTGFYMPVTHSNEAAQFKNAG